MAVLLGVVVAVSFGSADFLGGRASERASTLSVLFVGPVVAAAGALLVALVVSARVHGGDLGYGAAAGVANVVGLFFLYGGLARARMGIVAPLTAVVAAVVPIGWALLRGERPSAIVLVGATCAVIAGGLIARESDAATDDASARATASGVGYALGAGVMLGSALVLYSETADASGFWPIFASRATGLAVVGIVVAVLAARGARAVPAGSSLRLAAGAGVLDITATTVLLVAIRTGLLVVVAPVASLAPAFTVVWAWVLLDERISPTQIAGLGLALVGLVLVAAG